MHAPNLPDLRRSSRLPLALPILVTSLQPESDFSEVCETLVVNAHGCAIRSSMKLEPGAPVQFQSTEARAKCATCQWRVESHSRRTGCAVASGSGKAPAKAGTSTTQA